MKINILYTGKNTPVEIRKQIEEKYGTNCYIFNITDFNFRHGITYNDFFDEYRAHIVKILQAELQYWKYLIQEHKTKVIITYPYVERGNIGRLFDFINSRITDGITIGYAKLHSNTSTIYKYTNRHKDKDTILIVE